MPAKLTCERILATVDWADQVLRDYGVESGYGMDGVLRLGQYRWSRRTRSPRGAQAKAPVAPGKFARYLRGDCVPSRRVLENLDAGDGRAYARFFHPLYRVLQVGWDGYQEWEGQVSVEEAVDELDRRLPFRITRYLDQGYIYEHKPMTRRRVLDLTACGDGYAVAALLMAVLEADGEEALITGQCAFQCMVLAFARGEFPSTWPLVAARVRQQVLDRINHGGRALDTASIDLAATIATTREHARLNGPGDADVPASKDRQRLREWLKSAPGHVAAITPQIVPTDQAKHALAQNGVALKLQSAPRGRFNHVRDFGSSARPVLLRELRDYVAQTATALARADK
jgi:hypothetical protein